MHLCLGTCPSQVVLTEGASQVIKPGTLTQGTSHSYWFVSISVPLLSVLGYLALFAIRDALPST